MDSLNKPTKRILTKQNIIKYILPLVITFFALLFGFLNPRFWTYTNLTNIARQSSALAIIAIGQTIVIISGGIDLSQGSVIALTSVFGATQVLAYGTLMGISISIGLCAIIGIIHGILIARFKIPAFIVTLGALTFYKGATYVYSGGLPIGGVFPESFLNLGKGWFFGIPSSFVLAFAAFLCGYVFLTYTRPGREIYAIGGNEEAALLSGVNVDKNKILAFMICAICSGLGSLVLTSRIAVGQPTLGEGYQLDAVAAAVIGGTSLSGGEGNMMGTLLGVLFVGIIKNGLNLMKVSSFVQFMVVGVIIVTAVGIDVWQKKS